MLYLLLIFFLLLLYRLRGMRLERSGNVRVRVVRVRSIIRIIISIMIFSHVLSSVRFRAQDHNDVVLLPRRRGLVRAGGVDRKRV